jgi:hypothetical protein
MATLRISTFAVVASGQKTGDAGAFQINTRGRRVGKET